MAILLIATMILAAAALWGKFNASRIQCKANSNQLVRETRASLEDEIQKLKCELSNLRADISDIRMLIKLGECEVQEDQSIEPVMQHHERRKHRATDEYLNWLRKVAIKISDTKPDTWLPAAQILQEIEGSDQIDIPGCKDKGCLEENKVWSAACQGIGRRLSGLFKKYGENSGEGQETIPLDGYTVDRHQVNRTYDHSKGPKATSEYLFLPMGE